MPSAEAPVALSAAVDEPDAGEPTVPGRRTTWRRLVLVGLVVLLVASVPRFVVEPVTVQGDSMRPALHDGDHVLADKVTFRLRSPRRGDVVTVPDPRGRGTIVKRVVAIGGDSVAIEDGWLVVNGARAADVHADHTGMDGYFHGPVPVPDGFVYLLGDHRADSVDSRSFGPIRVDDIEGRVVGKG